MMRRPLITTTADNAQSNSLRRETKKRGRKGTDNAALHAPSSSASNEYDHVLMKHAVEQVFDSPTVVGRIIPFLGIRDIFNLIKSKRQYYYNARSLASRGPLQHDDVIRAAVLDNDTTSQAYLEAIMNLMQQRKIFVPSPLRLLQLCNARQCEICCQPNPLNDAVKHFGVFCCDRDARAWTRKTVAIESHHSTSGSHDSLSEHRAVRLKQNHEGVNRLQLGLSSSTSSEDTMRPGHRALRLKQNHDSLIQNPYVSHDRVARIQLDRPNEESSNEYLVWAEPIHHQKSLYRHNPLPPFGPIITQKHMEEWMIMKKTQFLVPTKEFIHRYLRKVDAEDLYVAHIEGMLREWNRSKTLLAARDQRRKEKKLQGYLHPQYPIKPSRNMKLARRNTELSKDGKEKKQQASAVLEDLVQMLSKPQKRSGAARKQQSVVLVAPDIPWREVVFNFSFNPQEDYEQPDLADSKSAHKSNSHIIHFKCPLIHDQLRDIALSPKAKGIKNRLKTVARTLQDQFQVIWATGFYDFSFLLHGASKNANTESSEFQNMLHHYFVKEDKSQLSLYMLCNQPALELVEENQLLQALYFLLPSKVRIASARDIVSHTLGFLEGKKAGETTRHIQLACGLWDLQIQRQTTQQKPTTSKPGTGEIVDPRVVYSICKATFPVLFQSAQDFLDFAKSNRAKNFDRVEHDFVVERVWCGTPEIVQRLLQRNFRKLQTLLRLDYKQILSS